MVTEQELRELLKDHRWTMRNSMRSGNQKVYTAAQRQGDKSVSRYIATEGRLAEMTQEEVLAKLSRPPKEQT